jgi:DNA-binding response OmpR family regulator
MPEMDGFTVCRRIREWSTVPVIMFSAREEEDDKEISEACGANYYLTQPFVLKEMLAQVKTILKPSRKSLVFLNQLNQRKVTFPR